MKKILIFALLIYSISAYSQNKFDVNSTEPIIFYGYEFSHFKLIDENREYQIGTIKNDLPKMVDYAQRRNKIEPKYLSAKFKRPVSFDFAYTKSIIKNMNEDSIVTTNPHKISKDSIQEIVNAFEITQKQGTGFVIIVESFDKKHEAYNAYYTYFDIATKKILRCDYFNMNDAGRGMGLVKHWGLALGIVPFTKYMKTVYWERS